MAIAFDNSKGGLGGGAFPFAYTCSGTSRLLIFTSVLISSGDNPPSPTYNGVALTQASKLNFSGTSWMYVYYLLNPASGSNNIAITGTSPNVSHIASYTGVSQAGFPDATATNSGSSTSLSNQITTVLDNCWSVMAIASTNGGTVTGGTNAVVRDSVNAVKTACILDTNTVITPPAMTTQACTVSGSNPFGIIQLSFAPMNTFTKTMSDAVSHGAGRTETVSKGITKSMIDSLSRGASRTITIASGKGKQMSDSIMNAAGRFVILISNLLWTRLTKSATTFSNGTKDSSSFSNQSKNPTSWIDINKS